MVSKEHFKCCIFPSPFPCHLQAIVIERVSGSAYILRTERDNRLVNYLTIQAAHVHVASGGTSLLFVKTDGIVRVGLSQSAHVG